MRRIREGFSYLLVHSSLRTRNQGVQLENVSIELWGFTLLRPTTTFTSLLLAAQCWVLFRRLRPAGVPGGIPGNGHGQLEADAVQHHPWSGFYFFMAIANLLSVAKHGIPNYLTAGFLAVTVFLSYLAAGLGILHLEEGTIRGHVKRAVPRRWLQRGAYGKFALFVIAIAVIRSILFVVVDAVSGLIPVLVAEGLSVRLVTPQSRWIAGGLLVSVLAVLGYLLQLSAHAWFDHRDLGHVLMMLGLWMFYRGVRPHPGAN